MTLSRMFIGSLIQRDIEDTGEVVDWLSSCRRAQEPTRSFVKPARMASGTQGPQPSSGRPNFARSESSCDQLRMETIEFLLENEGSEAMVAAPETAPEEDQDWDDYTTVEAALFLQPDW